MIPIRLTLQGLYSYQEKQIIDFTRLTRAHIFGIFGPVGSGKSAILEAICYALYGKTDRLNLSGDNRYYNMMNLKSNELLIEFIFTAGKEDTEYLTLVKSRRNTRQFEDVKAIEHTAYKKINNAWTPIEVDSLESIIGLSYENFKRTIIIPQGKFQEFLQLGNKERTQMMKELFNLEKYELFYKVVSLESKNNQVIQNLEGQLKQLGEINPDQIEACEKDVVVIRKEIETKQQEVTLQQSQESELRKLRDLVRSINETEIAINQLADQEPGINRLENTIREYEYCILNFKGIFETAEDISQKILRLRKNMAVDSKTLADIVVQLTEYKLIFEAAKKEFEGREIYARQAGELVKIAKLHELKELGKQLNESITHADKIWKATVDATNNIKFLQDGLKVNIQKLKLQYPDMSLLSEVREWYAVKRELESAKKETDHEIAASLEEINAIGKQSSGQTWEQLENKKNGLHILKDRLGNEIEHLSLQARLEEYATNLEEGKPCPLCGSLSHPLPLDSQNVKDSLLLIRQQRLDCERLIRDIELNQKKINETESSLQAKKDAMEKQQQKQNEQILRINHHQELFRWKAYKEEDDVRSAFSMAEKIRSRISETENELESINIQLDENNQLKENNLRIINDAKHQLIANKTESDTLQQQIELVITGEFINRSANEIMHARDNLLKKYRDAETSFQSTGNRLTNLQKDHDSISGRLQANQEALDGEIKSQEIMSVRIEEQLGHSGFSSLAEVKNVLSRKQDTENDKKKVSDFRQSFAVAIKQQSALKAELGEKKYDEEIHRQLAHSLQQAAEELNARNQNLGKLVSELKKMKSDLVAYTDMKYQMSALLIRGEDIKTLKQLFKASGFVNYISTVYLQELCHSANERFYKLTRQKLSLEVTDDNSFQVRDFLNGGKVRNVKTLSGGQTFQAALSLSLALADSIQKITESNQNFFFLDEGFGSLDKDSLAIVFDTLKSLRKENRIVGIISHVEEMQQEIDNYLKIVMDEERGSLIHCEPYNV